LITLIINVHTLGRMLATVFLAKRALDERISRNRTLMRKTRLLRKIEPTAMRSSVAERTVLQLDHLAMNKRRKQLGDNEGMRPEKPRGSALRSTTRIDLLFTMSEIPHGRSSERHMQSDVSRTI
jgi:hypothetical protein